jgi:tetratricopeptide (TPR) repeat protein
MDSTDVAIETLIREALEHHRAGRVEAAASIYEQVLSVNPLHADALHLLGLVVLQGRAPENAIELLKKAVSVQPGNWQFQANLAMALFELRRLDEALATYRQAARLNPAEPSLQMGIANCLALRGQLAEAETQLRKITQQHPRFTFAWFNLGNAVRDQGRNEESLRFFKRAIDLEPGFMDAYLGLGTSQQLLGRLDDAEQTYRAAVLRDAGHIASHLNLASVQIDRGRFAEAEQTCRSILAGDPRCATAHCFIGSAIGHQGRLLEALAHHREAVTLEPDNVRSQVALGIALTEIGRPVEGIRSLTHAIELAPDAWQARTYLSTAKRALGEFDDGWREYVHRANRAQFMMLYPDIKLSTVLPAALDGLHVCIQRQEGLGDQLFFLRYADALQRAGARITYRSTPKIASLLERVTAIDTVIPDTMPVPASDHVVLAGDLPLAALSMTLVDLPNAAQASHGAPIAPWPRAHGHVIPPLPRALALTPRNDKLVEMRARLAALGPPPYLGITWRGGVAPEQQQGAAWNLYKEVPLEGLGNAIKGAEATLLALQRIPLPGEIEKLAACVGKPVHDLSALNDDLETMLALLALIDDYVGVSNTNMHLRAGVDRAARVLMPCPAEWRWMLAGRESPWFPGFVIYRQTPDGDWSPALADLATDIVRGFEN